MLRTMLSKYKGFCASLGQGRKLKVDLFKGYWNPQRKIGLTSQAFFFFEMISLESEKRRLGTVP